MNIYLILHITFLFLAELGIEPRGALLQNYMHNPLFPLFSNILFVCFVISDTIYLQEFLVFNRTGQKFLGIFFHISK